MDAHNPRHDASPQTPRRSEDMNQPTSSAVSAEQRAMETDAQFVELMWRKVIGSYTPLEKERLIALARKGAALTPATTAGEDEVEPAGWQWKAGPQHPEIHGAGWTNAKNEERARELAKTFHGDVRPLYTSPPTSVVAVVERLREALERISQASPVNTNCDSARSMAGWCRAVADCALSDADEIIRALKEAGHGCDLSTPTDHKQAPRVSDEEFAAELTERCVNAYHKATLPELIDALLSLDAAGALIPHGVGGLARELLEKSCARIAELEAEVAQLRQERDAAWQPIETAPRSYHPPLSHINHHAPDILGVWGKAFWCICRWGGPSQPFWIGGDNKKVPFQPTHWKPLEEGPGRALTPPSEDRQDG